MASSRTLWVAKSDVTRSKKLYRSVGSVWDVICTEAIRREVSGQIVERRLSGCLQRRRRCQRRRPINEANKTLRTIFSWFPGEKRLEGGIVGEWPACEEILTRYPRGSDRRSRARSCPWNSCNVRRTEEDSSPRCRTSNIRGPALIPESRQPSLRHDHKPSLKVLIVNHSIEESTANLIAP